MRKALKNTDLVSWHVNPSSGHVKGLINEHVKQPYFAEISKAGEWALLTLGKDDKPRFVDRGHAKNVTKAKQAVTAAAMSKIPEIKAAIAESTSDVIETKARVIEPEQVSKRRAVFRWYSRVTTVILAALLFGYHWFRHQPLAVTLAILVLAGGLYCTYHITRFVDNEGAKLERIAKRRQIQQAKAIAQQQAPQVRQIRQAQPTRKVLRP